MHSTNKHWIKYNSQKTTLMLFQTCMSFCNSSVELVNHVLTALSSEFLLFDMEKHQV